MSTRVGIMQCWVGAIAVLLLPLMAYSAEEPLILGIFPRITATTVHDAFDPLAQYLSAELGREVKIETTKDQSTFAEAVASKRYDIVHFNQLNYVESHQKYGYDVIAINEEFGKSTVAGALVVRKDSGIKNIADLRGKTIVFGGGPKAMVAYIANVALLQNAGLKKGDYKEEFAKSPVNAMTAVFHKQAIAGGTGDIGLKAQAGNEALDVDELSILAVGEQLPHLPWAVKNTLSPELSKKIQDTLLKTKDSKNGMEILKAAHVTNLLPAKDSDFDPVRKMIKQVNTEPGTK